MIKAIIFDVDGTLTNTVGFHVKAFQTVFKKYGADLPKEEIWSYLGQPAEKILAELLPKYKTNVPIETSASEVRRAYFELVKGKTLFFPSTVETISVLSKKFKLGIFTGASRVQISVLGKFLEKFSFIVAGSECIKPKPFPDTPLLIAKNLGVSPSECAFVGDMAVDMMAGKSAGMLAIGLENKIASEEKLKSAGADIVIKNLKELLKLKALQK